MSRAKLEEILIKSNVPISIQKAFLEAYRAQELMKKRRKGRK